MCRDVFVHLKLELCLKAIENIKKSGIKYLLVTSFPVKMNKDISSGQWRPLNMLKPPFKLGNPLEIIEEEEKYNRKIVKQMLLFRL